MKQPPCRTSAGIPWGKAAAFVVLIVATIYASEHPHSFFYYFVKFIALPIP